MLPRCGSFLSVLPHALAQRSDPASEHPGFPSREGTQLYTTLSGMQPAPLAFTPGRLQKRPLCHKLSQITNCLPTPIVCFAWLLVLCTKMFWVGREGVGIPSFSSLIGFTCLIFSTLVQICIEVADPSGSRKMYSGKYGHYHVVLFLKLASLYWLPSS